MKRGRVERSLHPIFFPVTRSHSRMEALRQSWSRQMEGEWAV